MPSFTDTIIRQNPSEQLDLFTALEKVEQAANQEWLQRATERVRYLCQTRYEWCSDDVWSYLDTLDIVTGDNRALGAVIRKAAMDGWCAGTDRVVKSKRPACHSRPVALWQSLLLPQS